MHKLTGIMAVVLCIASGVIAEATPVYYFEFDSSAYNPATGNYEYTVSAGGTVTINVYLYEYSPGVGETYMAPSPPNAAEGLQSAGVALDIQSNTAGATVTFITGNPAFTDFNTYLSSDLDSPKDVGVLSFQGDYPTTAVYGTAIDAETTAILIGSFTFTVPPDAAIDSTTTIQATDLYSSMADNLSFETLTDLDALFGPGGYPTATITVVPEPPSVVALCGLAVMGGLMWVVRRVRGLRRA